MTARQALDAKTIVAPSCTCVVHHKGSGPHHGYIVQATSLEKGLKQLLVWLALVISLEVEKKRCQQQEMCILKITLFNIDNLLLQKRKYGLGRERALAAYHHPDTTLNGLTWLAELSWVPVQL